MSSFKKHKSDFKLFDLKENLLRVHTEGKDLCVKCQEIECNYKCRRNTDLKKHLWQVHEKGEGQWFNCQESQCNYKCKRNTDLKKHLWQVHEKGEGRWFNCQESQCNYKCKRNTDLKKHLWQVHEKGEGQWFHCQESQCDYKCKRSDYLNRHLWQAHEKGEGRWFYCNDSNCSYKCKRSVYLKKHNQAIHTKEGQQRQKKKEELTSKYLTFCGISFDRETQIDFKCALGLDRGQSFARIDFVVQCPDKKTIFLIEIDEFSHSSEGYLLSCECRRMMDATSSLIITQPEVQHWVWVRLNPDRFTIDNVKQHVSFQTRLTKLIQLIQNYKPVQLLEIKYLYYSTRCDEQHIQIPIIFDMCGFPTTLKHYCCSV
jgi:hypothetical protein